MDKTIKHIKPILSEQEINHVIKQDSQYTSIYDDPLDFSIISKLNKANDYKYIKQYNVIGNNINVSNKALHGINKNSGPLKNTPDNLILLRHGTRPKVTVEIGNINTTNQSKTRTDMFKIQFKDSNSIDYLKNNLEPNSPNVLMNKSELNTYIQNQKHQEENDRKKERTIAKRRQYNDLKNWTDGLAKYDINFNLKQPKYSFEFRWWFDEELYKLRTNQEPPFNDPLGDILLDFCNEDYKTHYVFYNNIKRDLLIQIEIKLDPESSSIHVSTFNTKYTEKNKFVSSNKIWLFNDFAYSLEYEQYQTSLYNNLVSETIYTDDGIQKIITKYKYQSLMGLISDILSTELYYFKMVYDKTIRTSELTSHNSLISIIQNKMSAPNYAPFTDDQISEFINNRSYLRQTKVLKWKTNSNSSSTYYLKRFVRHCVDNVTRLQRDTKMEHKIYKYNTQNYNIKDIGLRQITIDRLLSWNINDTNSLERLTIHDLYYKMHLKKLDYIDIIESLHKLNKNIRKLQKPISISKYSLYNVKF
jgi:AraC-like DNA-binding protein